MAVGGALHIVQQYGGGQLPPLQLPQLPVGRSPPLAAPAGAAGEAAPATAAALPADAAAAKEEEAELPSALRRRGVSDAVAVEPDADSLLAARGFRASP